MEKDKTRTDYFDRKINKEVYFSAVADNLLGKEGGAWGLISARMGRKSYVTEVLESCVFAKKNAGNPHKYRLSVFLSVIQTQF